MKLFSFAVIFIFAVNAAFAGELVTELRSAGYSLIPAPQKVHLSGKQILLDETWTIVARVDEQNMALQRMRSGAKELFRLDFTGKGRGKIILQIVPGQIKEPKNNTCREQAYSIKIADNKIEITGNADAGLYYGVQSLLQLLKPNGSGDFLLPEGTIVDWPTLEYRFIHWDTKHHQNRIKTLKRFIDWAAFFKVNAIGFEIEDKYEYPRHPVIGAPGAYTKEQMQDLTKYALQRFIQLVPQVQAPAHMAYVLKHDEFARLRSDGSNYQACLCDEEAIHLIQDMYQDMIDATPGVHLFHVSTDEIYYAGICSKCDKPYNPVNRSQYWVDYVKRTHEWMVGRGRRMLCWAEYPLLAKDIPQLPHDLIDGIMTPGKSPEFRKNENEKGIAQLAYNSMQGSELLFPNYFQCLYRGRQIAGRLHDASVSVQKLLDMKMNLIGTFAAAWDDAGLHDETFWLGWATVTQYGWTPAKPSLEQSIADFMDVFYGKSGEAMLENYRLLQRGARFFESSWDHVPATDLPPKYGNSKGKQNLMRTNRVIVPPALPQLVGKTLKADSSFSTKYTAVITRAHEIKPENEQLILSLMQSLTRVTRNRYNVNIFLSIAYFEKHFIDMILGLEKAEKTLTLAAGQSSRGEMQEALQSLQTTHRIVCDILRDRAQMWGNLKSTWEESRFPKGRSVDGRQFIHKLDDVKDHFADRRAGLDYMLAPLQRIGLEKWCADLRKVTKEFTSSNAKSPTDKE